MSGRTGPLSTFSTSTTTYISPAGHHELEAFKGRKNREGKELTLEEAVREAKGNLRSTKNREESPKPLANRAQQLSVQPAGEEKARGNLRSTKNREESPKSLANRAQQPSAQPASQEDEDESGVVRLFSGAAALAGLGYTAFNYWYASPETSATTTTSSVTTTASSQSATPVMSQNQEAPARERRGSEPRMHFSPPPSPKPTTKPWEPKDADQEVLDAIRQLEESEQLAKRLGTDVKLVAKTIGAAHRNPYL